MKPYIFDFIGCPKCRASYIGIAVNGRGVVSGECRFCVKCGLVVCNKCYDEKLDKCKYCD